MMNEAEELLEELAKLMELNGENQFKVRAFKKAAETLAAYENWRELARQGELEKLPGVGKGIAAVLVEYAETAHCTARDALLQAVPEGLVELAKIPGLGAKKARQLIDELGIHSVGELEYACRENHLLKLKGFGEKVQAKILEGAIFYAATRGQLRLSEALPLAQEMMKALQERFPKRQVFETGALRRKMETLNQLDFIVETREPVSGGPIVELDRKICEDLTARVFEGRQEKLGVQFHFSQAADFGYEWARTTASPEHWHALTQTSGKGLGGSNFAVATEEEFYARLSLPFIPPEIRETGEELELARAGQLDQLLSWQGIRGVFHNHTTRSDGSGTLEEMLLAAQALGYEYLGISDHSQSAFYARGLLPEALVEQKREISELRLKYPEMKIFWGIESDILADGSLDYSDDILSQFDFVVASIHSRFNMDRVAMTDRILKAIRNPHTRFLGHVTGRLLLARKGYDLDMETILAEAARCGVAVELNANPHRLDVDWRWGKVMRNHGTLTSINPDAHCVEGLKDTEYGIAMARKALLPTSQVVNARSAQEVEKWLKRK